MRDVNDRSNVTGPGINMAQRVMDCGDAGHILLSRRVAEDLEQYRLWQPCLHDLGECEVKHGVCVHVFNLYTDEIGNRDVPAKLKPIAQEPAAAVVTSVGDSARSKHRLIAATVLLIIALALGFVFWVVSHRAAPKSTSTSPKRSPSSPAPVEIGKPLDLSALAQKARGAVVLIVGYDAAGKIITGSGFFVSADGRLVTNDHVMQSMVNAQAKLESGAIYNIDGVFASSSALDLAVLKADARDMQFLLVDDASNPPQPGTRIAVIGSPLALEGSLSEGIVSAIRSRPDGSWLLQISAPISPGSSGSPVLDRHGRVIGVATLTAEEGQNLNFASSSHDLWNFLQTIDQDTKPKALSEKKDQILTDPDFIAAREANDRGDGAAALKLLNTLQQRYRNEPRLLFQFAYAYETLGLHDEAYRSWRADIDIDPTDPAAWRHFAIAAANLNRISEAINAYKQTLKMKPDADTWRLLGDLYDTQGQHALGVHAHDEAKRLESEVKIQHPAESSPASTAAQTPHFVSITKEHPYVNSLGMKFVPVAGTSVLFSVWDTRVKDYKIFADAKKHDWPKTDFKQTEEDPAVNVSWDDATAFCKWLTEKEQKAGLITATQSYRLPKDLEWSAAVGLNKESGSTPEQRDMKVKGIYPWGPQWPPPKGVGNYDPSLNVDDYKYTSPVGSFEANQYGLYDMGGNVWQWCEDWWNAEHKYRVLRGASWNNGHPGALLSSFRSNVAPEDRSGNRGFRCVLLSVVSTRDEKSSAPLGSTPGYIKALREQRSLSPSASPNDTGAQKLTRVYVKKYGVSALLPTDVFPDAKKLSNSDQSFLQGNSGPDRRL